MAYIYKATNLINGKFYIGRTSYNRLNKRINCHVWYANHTDTSMPFPNAIKKYGKENFKWEIIEECEKNDAGNREMYWIRTLNPEYNATLGGDGGISGRPCPEHVKEATRKSRIIPVKDRKTGKIFSSLKEAKEYTGVTESSISRSLKKFPTTGRWEKII